MIIKFPSFTRCPEFDVSCSISDFVSYVVTLASFFVVIPVCTSVGTIVTTSVGTIVTTSVTTVVNSSIVVGFFSSGVTVVVLELKNSVVASK